MDKQIILDKFKLKYQNLTENQKKIARYILDHYETVAFMSANNLADAVGVSDATVIRFSVAVGFKGYADMIKQIRSDNGILKTPDERISKSLALMQNQKNLFKKIINHDINNLNQFAKELDLKRIKAAVDEIYKARRIFLMGIGSSSLLANFLHMQLRRMGFDVMSTSESTMFDYEKMLLIKKGDLLIVCSFPRYAKNTLNAAAFAKKKKVKVIAITDSDFSPICVNSDIILRAKIDNITFFHSWVVGMELCNLLLMSILERNGEKIYEMVKESKKDIKYFYHICQKD